MKTLTKTGPTQLDIDHLRTIVSEALSSVENARQKCLAAGQMLNEFKAAIPTGKFMEWRRASLPDVSDDTCEIWMRAAANVAKALPPVPSDIDIEASVILLTPDDELTPAALEWKQGWFDFTHDKTIKDCLNGVLINGDDAHRTDRAINGKTKGGAGGDRKDFPLFVAVKLKDMAAHMKHWAGMTETQKAEIKVILANAIKGEPQNIRKQVFNFGIWPEEFCEAAIEALKERMKGAKR